MFTTESICMISITKLPGKAGTLPVEVSKFSEVCGGGG